MQEEVKLVSNKYQMSSGMVSILTVIFFIIFITILSVSFIKIMADEQRQSIDNDLSASAFAAAQSGIEDAKRVIAYCANPTDPADIPACQSALQSGNGAGNCGVFVDGSSGMNGLRSKLGIKLSADGKEVVVGADDGQFAQYYTCLMISFNTSNVKLDVTEGKSQIQELLGSAGFDQLDIAWEDQNSNYAIRPASTLLPVSSQWRVGTTAIPPILRLHFIPYTQPIDVNLTESASRTVFLSPASNPSAGSLSIDARGGVGDLRSSLAAPIIYSGCDVTVGYKCSTSVAGFDTTKRYFVRASLLYGANSTVTITPKLAGNPVMLNGAQPKIDVTGRASDVYRRIESRVAFQAPGAIFPEYALESTSPVCKRMVVTNSAATTSFNCP